MKYFYRIILFLIRKLGGAVYVLNGILTLAILVLLAYVIYLFLLWPQEKQENQEMIRGAQMPANPTVNQTTVSFMPKPLSYYAQRFNKKGIFQPPLSSSAPINATEPSPTEQGEQKLQQLIKNLILVGIVIDQKPVAIIEDEQTQETLFLSPGDPIREAVVEEIKKNAVILKYQGGHIELTQ